MNFGTLTCFDLKTNAIVNDSKRVVFADYVTINITHYFEMSVTVLSKVMVRPGPL